MPETAEKLLMELIALPSVNPAFMPPSDPRAGETHVAEFLAAEAARAGFSVSFQDVLPGRQNLWVHYEPPRRSKQRVILAPHLDTVGSPDMPDGCFQPVLRQGRIHGRGACDTKGSVSAMFTALTELAHSTRRPQETEILFVGLVDEENAQEGSRAFASSGLKGNLAIVGEPTELKVVTAHKGDLWLKLMARGKAAHGARPELGSNAVHLMSRIVHLLETKYARELSRRKHKLLGHPTINVGAIRGGTQPNIVPDYCEIDVDRRTIPGEKDKRVVREIKQFLQENGLEAEIADLKLKGCMSLETDPDMPLVRLLMEQTGQRTGLGVDFFCDAAILAAGGTPSVVFGPGNIAQAHTADEWISAQSLRNGTKLLKRFLESLP